MRKNQSCLGIVALFVTLAASASTASAGAISNNFSLGFGYTNGTNQWNDGETVGANTGVVGDFTLSVNFDPNTAFTSGAGVDFNSRILTDGFTGSSQGRSSTFGLSLTATYTGSQPVTDTTLFIDSIRIFAGNHSAGSVTNTPGGSDLINWVETTVGNAGSSPQIDLGIGFSDTSLVSNYDQLVWDPADVAIPGLSSTRVFSLGTNGVLNAYLDGFEVFGHIEAATIPEPSTFLLLGLGMLGTLRHARRRRRRA